MQLASFRLNGEPPTVVELHAGLNVLTTPDQATQDVLVGDLREALMGGPAGITLLASMEGGECEEVSHEAMFKAFGADHDLDPVTTGPMLQAIFGSKRINGTERDRHIALAITAALDALGIIEGTDPIPRLDVSTVQERYRQVRLERSDIEREEMFRLNETLDPATEGRDAACIHRDLIDRLRPEIDEAYASILSAKAAVARRFSGNAAADRLNVSQLVLDELIDQLGYASYVEYTQYADGQRVRLEEEIERCETTLRSLRAHHVAVLNDNTSELGWLRHQETLLRLRLGLESNMDNLERLGGTALSMVKLRRQLQGEVHRQLEKVLTILGVPTSEATVIDDAQRWLDSCGRILRIASPPDETKLTMAALWLRGRIRQHLSIATTGGFPMVLDDLFAGPPSIVSERLLPLLVNASESLQIILVTQDVDVAAMVARCQSRVLIGS